MGIFVYGRVEMACMSVLVYGRAAVTCMSVLIYGWEEVESECARVRAGSRGVYLYARVWR